MKSFFTILLFLCFAVTAIAETPAENNCVELLQSRCQACHYLDRVCKEAGERSKRGWKKTITRMVNRRGAEITADEQKILLDCLRAPASDIREECSRQQGAN